MMRKRVSWILSIIMIVTFFVVAPEHSLTVLADTNNISINGSRYEFGEKSSYELPNLTKNNAADHSLGNLVLEGDIKSSGSHYSKVKEEFPSYTVADDQLFTIRYNYTDSLLNADEKSWHLYSDNGKKVDEVTLDSSIKNGAIILQTSLDGFNWVTSSTKTDLVHGAGSHTFSNEINDIQLVNGCFYRIIVAYELRQKVNSTDVTFIAWDFASIPQYEFKKIADVYEFYVSYDISDEKVSGEKYNFYVGAQSDYTHRTKKNDYAGSEIIDNKDPHFGWNLGLFCLSGYTDKGDAEDVYFKTVGNKIKLNFTLNENITKLHGNDKLSILDDTDGSDTGFSVSKHNMGHGELIVKHTNAEGTVKITSYSNYLEALASPSADTTIKLFEEGDYEVHLDYAIKNAGNFGKITYYQTSFSFKIRNGNCMVYIFDTTTGRELQNGDNTDNGFYVDSAKSGYPKLNVKKDVPGNGGNSDTRFNRAVTDGERFTDEGIYTITASNRYDSTKTTEKTIYVGINTKDVALCIYEIGGEDLYNGAETAKGFEIDIEGSGSPDIKVKKEVYKDNSGNLREEYSGRTVKPGEKFTEDGIYTITAINKYNSEKRIEQKIKVGTSVDLKLKNAETGEPITNGSVVSGGFYIDNQGSGYPKIDIRREIINSENNGLKPNWSGTPGEDERFTDSGIYTIIAENRYNNSIKTEIRVYVGNDPVLIEYMKDPDNSDIGDIFASMNGETALETTTEATKITTEQTTTVSESTISEETEVTSETTAITTSLSEATEYTDIAPTEEKKSVSAVPFVLGGIALAGAGGGAFYFVKRKKRSGGDVK